MAKKELNYYPPHDPHMRDFVELCRKWCNFTIDNKRHMVVFDLDTTEKEEKFEDEFNGFNWND